MTTIVDIRHQKVKVSNKLHAGKEQRVLSGEDIRGLIACLEAVTVTCVSLYISKPQLSTLLAS